MTDHHWSVLEWNRCDVWAEKCLHGRVQISHVRNSNANFCNCGLSQTVKHHITYRLNINSFTSDLLDCDANSIQTDYSVTSVANNSGALRLLERSFALRSSPKRGRQVKSWRWLVRSAAYRVAGGKFRAWKPNFRWKLQSPDARVNAPWVIWCWNVGNIKACRVKNGWLGKVLFSSKVLSGWTLRCKH